MSLSELFLIFIIALVVLGPRQFLSTIRSASALYHSIKRYYYRCAYDVRQELDVHDRSEKAPKQSEK